MIHPGNMTIPWEIVETRDLKEGSVPSCHSTIKTIMLPSRKADSRLTKLSERLSFPTAVDEGLIYTMPYSQTGWTVEIRERISSFEGLPLPELQAGPHRMQPGRDGTHSGFLLEQGDGIAFEA
ncbi:MAG: hypothetical protein HZB92_03245 [Euryarchaeota archaeon]|nr:hypothetical protein [Euryarchaeota archaeon]